MVGGNHQVKDLNDTKTIVEDYYKRTKSQAERYTERWQSDGEGDSAILYPMAWSNISKIETYADELLDHLDQ